MYDEHKVEGDGQTTYSLSSNFRCSNVHVTKQMTVSLRDVAEEEKQQQNHLAPY